MKQLGRRDATNGSLRFDYVYASSQGTYQLAIDYFSAVPRTMTVLVNGQAQATVTVDPTDGWCGPGVSTARINVPVELARGNNNVTITNPDGLAPAIDKLVTIRTG